MKICVSGYRIERPLMPADLGPCGGRTWFVSPDGVDSARGTLHNPLSTFASALSLAKGGDTVFALPGTYAEQIIAPNTLQIPIPGPQVTVAAWPPGRHGLGSVVVTMPQYVVDAGKPQSVVELRANMNLYGLVIRGVRQSPNAPASGITGWNGIHHLQDPSKQICTVEKCGIFENSNSGINHEGFCVVRSCIIANNGQLGTDHGIYCDSPDGSALGNIIFGHHGGGIHYYSGQTSCDRAKIRRNLVFGNWYYGILCNGGQADIQHNTVVGSRLNFYGYGGKWGGIVGLNIFANGYNGINVDSSPMPGSKIGPNCVFGNTDRNFYLGSALPELVQNSGDIVADPLFAEPAAGDFTLQPGSLAARCGCYAT